MIDTNLSTNESFPTAAVCSSRRVRRHWCSAAFRRVPTPPGPLLAQNWSEFRRSSRRIAKLCEPRATKGEQKGTTRPPRYAPPRRPFRFLRSQVTRRIALLIICSRHPSLQHRHPLLPGRELAELGDADWHWYWCWRGPSGLVSVRASVRNGTSLRASYLSNYVLPLNKLFL